MINSVRLRNWKSHIDSEFVFDKGVNALIGIMGSGKSSVMQGISFALYGTFPSIQSRKINLDDLIMRKPQRKGYCEVELDFNVRGRNYSVKRRIDMGKGTTLAELREEGKLIEVSPTGVTKEVERILQMDYDLFSRAVYSEQNGLDYFLRLPRGSRMKQIDEMLKVNRFESAREGIVSIMNRIRGRREDRLKVISDMEKEGIEGKIDSVIKEIRDLNNEMEHTRNNLLAITRERKRISRDVMLFESKEKEMNSIVKEIEGIRRGLEEIEENIHQKKDKLKGRDSSEIKLELENLGKEIKNSYNILKKETEMLDRKRSELASLNTEIKFTSEGIKDLSSLESTCPVCESPVSQERKQRLLEERIKKETNLRVKVSSLAAEIEGLSERKKSLEKEIRNKEIDKEKIVNLIEETGILENLEKRKKEYENRESSLAKREYSLTKELGEANVSSLRENLQERIAKEGGLVVKRGALEDKIKGKGESLNELKERQGRLKEYKEAAAKDKEIAEALENFIGALKSTQEQLRQSFLINVNSIMNSVWMEIYPYGDFEEIRLIIDKDYVLQLKEMGRWVTVDGVASGGERSLAALALRIAFSLAFIPNLKWLILDEPTHNLDSNAIRNFTGILREKIHLFTEQLFLITHEESISDGITGSLYKLERNKEANEATRIVS